MKKNGRPYYKIDPKDIPTFVERTKTQSLYSLAKELDVDKATLAYHIRRYKHGYRPLGEYKPPEQEKPKKEPATYKYQNIIEEKTGRGKSYAQYLKDSKQKSK